MGEEVLERLNAADEALTNLPDDNEAFTSSVQAARSSINAARAIHITLTVTDDTQDDDQ